MPFVVDASFAAGWFLPTQANETATRLIRRLDTDNAVVPDLFRHELRNLLLSAFRRQKLDRAMLFEQTARAERFPFEDAGPGEAVFILRLALEHGLTAYDAAYLALALTRRLELATNDAALVKAGRKEGIGVVTRGDL